MPVLPKVLSEKVLNVTKRVQNFVESWDIDESNKHEGISNQRLKDQKAEVKNISNINHNEKSSVLPSQQNTSNKYLSPNGIERQFPNDTELSAVSLAQKESISTKFESEILNQTNHLPEMSPYVVPPPSIKTIIVSQSNDNAYLNVDGHSNFTHGNSFDVNCTTVNSQITEGCSMTTECNEPNNFSNKYLNNSEKHDIVENLNPNFSSQNQVSIPHLQVQSVFSQPTCSTITTSISVYSNNSCHSVWSSPTSVQSVSPQTSQPILNISENIEH